MGENILWFIIGAACVAVPLAILIVFMTRKPKVRVHFIVTLSDNIKLSVMTVKMRNNQYVLGSLSGTDAKGDTAPIDKITSVESDDSNVATVSIVDGEAEGDQKGLRVDGQHAGVTIGRGTVDVRLGDEVKNVPFEFAIDITSGEAENIGINFGEPKDQE